MRRKILLIAAVLGLLFGAVSFSFAATDIRIAASIGEVHQMNVALNRINGSTWTPITDLVGQGMDFGTLTKGSDNIFRTTIYYVVDAPVFSNRASWTITHTASDFASGVNNLNNNVNVKFVKVDNVNSAETALASNSFISYQAAKTRPPILSSELIGGRLRVYYSIAGGSGDAPGVSVITTSSASGSYFGTVTLTLSP